MLHRDCCLCVPSPPACPQTTPTSPSTLNYQQSGDSTCPLYTAITKPSLLEFHTPKLKVLERKLAACQIICQGEKLPP